MHTKYTLLLLFMLAASVNTVLAGVVKWDFTDTSKWTGTITTGYYTVDGTKSESTPSAPSIYVLSTNGFTTGGYLKSTNCTSSPKTYKPSDNYIKVTIPAQTIISTTLNTSSNNNTITVLYVEDDNGSQLKLDYVVKAKKELSYTNNTDSPAYAYIYNNTTNADAYGLIYDITLTPINGYTYTVNYTDGTVSLMDPVQGQCNEGDTYTVSCPKVIEKDGRYFVLKGSESQHNFTKTYTMGSDDETQTIEYVEDNSIVFFKDYSGVDKNTASGGSVMSNMDANASLTLCSNLPAGKYSCYLNVFPYDGTTRTEVIKAGGTEIHSVEVQEGADSVHFETSSTCDITLAARGQYTNLIDYILIRKQGAIATTMKCNPYKLGTFCAPYAVILPEHIKAYGAKFNEENTSLTLTREYIGGETLPAGTPVIIYFDDDSNLEYSYYGISTTSESTCKQDALVGILTTDGRTIPVGSFVIQTKTAADNTTSQGFYYVSKSGKGSVNRCYISLPSAINAKSLSFTFDDASTPTAVDVASSTVNVSPVIKAVKNSQLIIIKDGVEYNATGVRIK